MQAIIEAIQNNLLVVGAIVIVFVPIAYIYRQYTWPIFFHLFEAIVYATSVQLILGGFVRGFKWFKESSSFNNEIVPWSTPLLQPWAIDAYNPRWLFYFTVACWIAIAYIIIVIRPVGVKNRYKHTAKPTSKKPGAVGAKPAGSTYQYTGGRKREQSQSIRRR